MADEDSFVILGTSPPISIETISIPINNNNNDENLKETQLNVEVCDGIGTKDQNSLNTNGGATDKNDDNKTIFTASAIDEPFSMISIDNKETSIPSKIEMTSINSDHSSIAKINDDVTKQTSDNLSSLSDLSLKSSQQSLHTATETPQKNLSWSTYKASAAIEISKHESPSSSITTGTTVSFLNDSKKNPLAASFLLGEVCMEEIKDNVFSQFQSLCSTENRPDMMIKIQNLITENIKMKENMKETNSEMRLFIDSMKKWKDEIKSNYENQKTLISNSYELIAKLKSENEELKTDLNDKIKCIQVHDDDIKTENDELRKTVSEKNSLIQNLSAHIQTLNDKSTAYVGVKDENIQPLEREFVPIQEYKNTIKNLEMELKRISDENIKLKKLENEYAEEITLLKVKLTSIKQKLFAAENDIILLKNKNTEKQETFENYERVQNEMKNEIAFLREQSDVYFKDFQMERQSREKLAGEKEQLLTDLKLLQRKNQKLIEETQSRFEQAINPKPIPCSSTDNTTKTDIKKMVQDIDNEVLDDDQPQNESTDDIDNDENDDSDDDYTPLTETLIYTCPLCSKYFTSLHKVQEHVEDCIDTK